ncbi:Protein N-acetyltransferase, RimJ/RimL family [Virgibacillus subterraneus]|uniref:Protein N-acetyltransferase, RimJ/RimL family n=1 Tax=Virgibacillus subterraneus TaxID=621109 RepID=A0A1H9JNE0_9BACI|nr:GNAT family N-acetyltransferase [Virgibacillus subterraneus]SEQ88326.1 Protein N-acetyltransferase, RimJ/RimL family [Virgibacillus subterraneus]
MNTYFIKLKEPTPTIVKMFNQWENDPNLVPLTRPNRNKVDVERQVITIDDITQRLEHHHIYLIYLDDKLIGEMNYMVDPPHLYQKKPGTAWIGITIGEPEARGKGVGYRAIQFLEEQVKQKGLKRIELGVFEFNMQAHKLYKKLGYQEIGSIHDFTFWQNRMWSDIRMEKVLG